MSTQDSRSSDGEQAAPSTTLFVQLTYFGVVQVNKALRDGTLEPRDVLLLLDLASRRKFRRDDLKLPQAKLAKTKKGRTQVNKSIGRLELQRFIAIEEGSPLRYIMNPVHVRQGGKKILQRDRKVWFRRVVASHKRRRAFQEKRDAKRGKAPEAALTLAEIIQDSQKADGPPPPTEPTDEERKKWSEENRKKGRWVRLGTRELKRLVKSYRGHKLSPTALRVLLLLIERVCFDKDPLLWRRAVLAADLGKDEAAVSHALAELVEEKLLLKVKQGRTQSYVFNPDLVTQGTLRGDVDARNAWMDLRAAYLAEVEKKAAKSGKDRGPAM